MQMAPVWLVASCSPGYKGNLQFFVLYLFINTCAACGSFRLMFHLILVEVNENRVHMFNKVMVNLLKDAIFQ